jgi:hypothetical protein
VKTTAAYRGKHQLREEIAMNDCGNKSPDGQVKAGPTCVGDTNPDPITGAPGSHPVGTGLGASSGGLAGAAVGAVAGPVGAVVGAAVGAVAGALAGKGVAELVDPTAEDSYWRANYTTRPYYLKVGNYDYNDYGPAYRLGWESRSRFVGRPFDEFESELARDWSGAKDRSRLTWDSARHAARAAWQRASDTVERLAPGDSDRDGK